MAARFPPHSLHQQFVTEQYRHESDARIRFYQEQKARKAGITLPPVIRAIPDIIPTYWAINRKKEEDARMQEIREEVSLQRSRVPMRPVDHATRDLLYLGVSKEQEGRHQYLHDRLGINPETKYHFPLLTSWKYGWKIGGLEDYYRRPTYARTAKIKENFYSRNGVPYLTKDKTVCESIDAQTSI